MVERIVFFFLLGQFSKKRKNVTVRLKLDVWVANLERYLVKVVHMDHTQDVGFGENLFLYVSLNQK